MAGAGGAGGAKNNEIVVKHITRQLTQTNLDNLQVKVIAVSTADVLNTDAMYAEVTYGSPAAPLEVAATTRVDASSSSATGSINLNRTSGNIPLGNISANTTGGIVNITTTTSGSILGASTNPATTDITTHDLTLTAAGSSDIGSSSIPINIASPTGTIAITAEGGSVYLNKTTSTLDLSNISTGGGVTTLTTTGLGTIQYLSTGNITLQTAGAFTDSGGSSKILTGGNIALGGASIGLLAAFADFTGALGTGTGILLMVTIILVKYPRNFSTKTNNFVFIGLK